MNKDGAASNDNDREQRSPEFCVMKCRSDNCLKVCFPQQKAKVSMFCAAIGASPN
jgi:hypothetical protein